MYVILNNPILSLQEIEAIFDAISYKKVTIFLMNSSKQVML